MSARGRWLRRLAQHRPRSHCILPSAPHPAADDTSAKLEAARPSQLISAPVRLLTPKAAITEPFHHRPILSRLFCQRARCHFGTAASYRSRQRPARPPCRQPIARSRRRDEARHSLRIGLRSGADVAGDRASRVHATIADWRAWERKKNGRAIEVSDGDQGASAEKAHVLSSAGLLMTALPHPLYFMNGPTQLGCCLGLPERGGRLATRSDGLALHGMQAGRVRCGLGSGVRSRVPRDGHVLSSLPVRFPCDQRARAFRIMDATVRLRRMRARE